MNKVRNPALLCAGRYTSNRSYYIPPKYEAKNKRYNWIFGLGFAGAITFGLWWVYYPHHNYPRSVAKILRKASFMGRK